jgi:hypothetical protein
MEQERIAAVQVSEQGQLLQRRKRLAALYNSEIQAWETEVLETEETPEQRKQRCAMRGSSYIHACR